MENIYRKNKSNVDLFDSYALQLVSGMLLYERIKLQQKKLYLTQAKKQGGKFLGGRFSQSLTCRNFFSAGEALNIISNAERKMQSVENWIKFVKRPLPKCFQTYIENLHEDEKERLRELYREFHEKKVTGRHQ
jgi:hypothetical protein